MTSQNEHERVGLIGAESRMLAVTAGRGARRRTEISVRHDGQVLVFSRC